MLNNIAAAVAKLYFSHVPFEAPHGLHTRLLHSWDLQKKLLNLCMIIVLWNANDLSFMALTGDAKDINPENSMEGIPASLPNKGMKVRYINISLAKDWSFN